MSPRVPALRPAVLAALLATGCAGPSVDPVPTSRDACRSCTTSGPDGWVRARGDPGDGRAAPSASGPVSRAEVRPDRWWRDGLRWGDLHGHTALSDGAGTVADYFAFARDRAGLDFAIVTDHDFGNGPPWRMPEADWNAAQDAADACDDAGRFVAICGFEWTSQAKYWSGVPAGQTSEGLFAGSPRFYNHKLVYFPDRIPYLLSSKAARFRDPERLAAAVARLGGLGHHGHPTAGPDGRDQWQGSPAIDGVLANTEIGPDVVWHRGQRYEPGTERAVIELLNRGGRVGFVGGSDTHAGRPQARTAVFAGELSRAAVFAALRARRCYAVAGARIELQFAIDGRPMGGEAVVDGAPELEIEVRGTAPIAELAVVRDGDVVLRLAPGRRAATVRWRDEGFAGRSWYYVRVTQADADEHGNPSRAWSSPIWVERRRLTTAPAGGVSGPPPPAARPAPGPAGPSRRRTPS